MMMYFPQKLNHILTDADRFYIRWISSINVADVRVRALGIVFICFLNVSVGAFFYKIASGSRRSWPSAFFRVYSVLLDAPGSDATDDDEFVASLVLNIIYLVGLIVFAVLIGMVGEEVTVQVRIIFQYADQVLCSAFHEVLILGLKSYVSFHAHQTCHMDWSGIKRPRLCLGVATAPWSSSTGYQGPHLDPELEQPRPGCGKAAPECKAPEIHCGFSR
jgi:hypothetical protein